MIIQHIYIYVYIYIYDARILLGRKAYMNSSHLGTPGSHFRHEATGGVFQTKVGGAFHPIFTLLSHFGP